MNIKNKFKFNNRFLEEVTIMNMNKEYPGYSGKEKHILFTDTPEAILKAAYPEEMEILSPYILCPGKAKEVFLSFYANESKYAYRAMKDEAFLADEYSKGNDKIEPSVDSEVDLAESEEAEERWRISLKVTIKETIEKLTPNQKKRLYKYRLEKKTFQEIAMEEGVSLSSVYESINRAKTIMEKDFFKKVRKNFAADPEN